MLYIRHTDDNYRKTNPCFSDLGGGGDCRPVVGGGAIPDADAHTLSGSYPHNSNLDVKFNVNTGTVTVDLLSGNFKTTSKTETILFNHDSHRQYAQYFTFPSDSNTITINLSSSDYNKFKNYENLGMSFPLRWAVYDSGLYVPTGSNTVTRTHIPPVITGGTYDVDTGAISITTDSDIKAVTASSICIVVRHASSLGSSPVTTCASSATVSNKTISASVPVSPGSTADTISLEVSKYAVQATNDVWNKEAYSSTSPSKIMDLSASSGRTSIDLSWSAPSSGSTITDYKLEVTEARGGADVSWSKIVTGTSYGHNTANARGDEGETYPKHGILYEYRVRAANSLGSAPWSEASVGSLIYHTDTVPAKMSAPTAQLNAAGTAMDVSWTEPDTPDGGLFVTGYTIEWKVSGTTGGTAEDVSGTSWTHDNLTTGTLYEYRMRAENVIGDGPWSDTTSAWSSATVPAKVTDLTAASGATVQLSWSAPSERGSPITGYTVEWKASGGNATTVAVNGTSWNHAATTPGTLYEYRVRAVNSIGDGPWSDTTSEWSNATAPAKITDLTATSGATVQLSWSAPSERGSPITGYTVEWKTRGGNATTVAVSGTSWEHTTVTLGTTYEYRVRAANSIGDGPWSDMTVAQTKATAPAKVTGLTAASGATVQLSWSAPGNGGSAITGYTVEWKASGGTATTVAVNGTSWEHTAVTPVTTYEYRVRAANSIGDGPWSDTASAQAITTPAKVTGLTTSVSGTTLQLSWSAPGNGGSAITGYTVEWKTSGGTATTVAVNGTSWEHTTVTLGTIYEYRVRAANSIGDGPWSDTTSVNATTVPAKVTGLTASMPGTAVNLSWSAPSNGGSAITGYTVERTTNGLVTTSAASGTSWSQAFSYSSPPSEYRVRATNAIGDGPWSSSVKVSCVPYVNVCYIT